MAMLTPEHILAAHRPRRVILHYDAKDVAVGCGGLAAPEGMTLLEAYRARLWGAELSAPRDAVLVFYRVERDEGGAIVDMRYNFVAREEFDKSYRIVEA